MAGTWLLEATDRQRFPYRLTVLSAGQPLLCLWVQERWPGTKGHVFCIRDDSEPWQPAGEEVERVPVVSFRRQGKRLIVVLERPQNKRCDFLFLKKKYKKKPGEYEQIFWRTEAGLKERRSRVVLGRSLSRRMRVAVDRAERYAWKFSGAEVSKERLPAGDYALLDEDSRIVAIVERKTFADLLASIGRLDAFHQQLVELESFPNAALVVEANYADFLNPGKLGGYYSPNFLAMVIAEICHAHPRLQVIFAGNRKLAAYWTQRYFVAVAAAGEEQVAPELTQVEAVFERSPRYVRRSANAGLESLKRWLPKEFSIAEVRQAFPCLDDRRIRRHLASLRDRGWIVCRGRGLAARWEKTDSFPLPAGTPHEEDSKTSKTPGTGSR